MDPDIDMKIQTLESLSLDCLLQIFEYLSSSDLASLGTTNKYFLAQVEIELRHRFSSKLVKFRELIDFPIGESLAETDDSIIVNNASTAALILQHFGDSIRALKIMTSKDANPNSIETIFTLIEKHCSDSLVELHLFKTEHNFFKSISKPFTRIEIVSFAWNTEELGNVRFTFSDVFPALRQLELDVAKLENSTEIAITFPDLVQLSLSTVRKANPDKFISETVAIELIKKNPRIKSLILNHVTPNVLKVVSDTLHKLERLELYSYSQEDQRTYDFHFENVKVFKLGNWLGFDWPRNINFTENLEEFDVEPTEKDTKYIELIKNNKGLQKLRINGKHFNNDAILKLSQIKLNIVDVALGFYWNIDIKNIIQFIENHPQLKNVQLFSDYQNGPFPSTKNDMVVKIHKYLGNKWEVNANKFGFFLEKKDIILV